MAQWEDELSAFAGWEVRLLEALGIAPTKARRDFLAAWHACEGGSAAFNPLNTTQDVPGATDYNSVGVKNYPDAISGLAATLLTLRLAPYADLRRALAATGFSALRIAKRSERSLATWGTGSACILSRLR